jgi:hypothetical protein
VQIMQLFVTPSLSVPSHIISPKTKYFSEHAILDPPSL